MTVVLVLSAFALFWVPEKYPPTYIIKAEKLAKTPDSYMPIANPDTYVLEATSNREGVIVHSLDVTMIDELMGQQVMENDTSNFLINNSYYQIMIIVVDAFPPAYLSMMFLASHVTLPASAVALALILIAILVKRNKK